MVLSSQSSSNCPPQGAAAPVKVARRTCPPVYPRNALNSTARCRTCLGKHDTERLQSSRRVRLSFGVSMSPCLQSHLAEVHVCDPEPWTRAIRSTSEDP